MLALSSGHELILNRHYQQIIGLGSAAIPLLLRELKSDPASWLWALEVVSRESPAPREASAEEVARIWLDWGRTHGYVLD